MSLGEFQMIYQKHFLTALHYGTHPDYQINLDIRSAAISCFVEEGNRLEHKVGDGDEG